MSTQRIEAAMSERGPQVALVCPACGGANDGGAVFCANPRCGKALGPFLYVREEMAARTRWYERLADRATGFISRPHFLLVHALWFALWLAVNTGLFALVGKFDDYPYNLLGLILSAESIFITGFLLISQSRQNLHADKRAELDYEVNVRTYREISQLKELLQALEAQLAQLERPRRTL
jgi:uncharacterized membrane protein